MTKKTLHPTSLDRWTPADRSAAQTLAYRHARAVERLRVAQAEAEATIARFEHQFPEAGDAWADFVLDESADPKDKTKTNEEIHRETFNAIRGIVTVARRQAEVDSTEANEAADGGAS